ncbi:membrane protein required for colicin V production [Fibrobacter sp. UWB15]|uniref:CvpA family protein n=1 Tax=unclassified Fibrobacter TaxID=2634177 RepID=UPI000910F519|nr:MULTISPECIES: CvpA family protein [unclassified Fibrobacter]PWJ65621.1 membrane protein required for colicin V production [Fibrobacter sp. UWB6]SHF97546.1 membrane protein required for colicin V production [Fibrobacter sp. UWB8]SMG23911.1 membrane protein required for colicin V production [Fibrobacter sp. UWB15]
MNAIDIVCLVIILFLMLLGLWHGFFRGIFRLIAWAAGIVGAYFACGLLAEFISSTLQSSAFSTKLVCMCIGFLVPFLFFLFVGHFLQHITEGTKVGKADRILGGIFGVIKALLICFVLLTILHLFPFGGIVPETRDNAFAYDAYKATLELMGYSSEPVDLLEVAEKKASEVVKNATDKAAEKAAEAAKDVADKAVEKATEAAKETVKGAVSNAVDTLKK